jgi:hypothetical protein
MGPKAPHSTVLTLEEEAMAVAFRRHTLLPLDDCLYALQATIPRLTRSSLHRLFQRHDISRLPIETEKTAKQTTGAGGRHGHYGSALAAHPGEPQERPDNGSGSQPMV